MAFGVKHFQSITASIVNYFSGVTKAVTDFNVGSKIRSIIEAVALEIEQIYYQLYIGITGAIETAIFNSFNFPALPSQNATTLVRFSRTTPAPSGGYDVPAGTVVTTEATDIQPAVTFHTIDSATLLAGQTYVDVMVICETAGAVGNVEANTITIMNTAPTGVEAVTNTAKVITGRDAETDDQRKTRFQNYIDTLSRGTLPALEYAAMLVPTIIDAIAVETPNCSCFTSDASNASFVDNSFEANLPTGIPFYGLPPSVGVNDAMYIGNDSHFDSLRADLSIGSVGNTLVWEYFNGSAWVTLPTTDDTNYLAINGIVAFTMPSDWRKTAVNGVSKFWIRLRVITANVSQVPKIYQITLPPYMGIVYIIAYDASMTASPDLIKQIVASVDKYRASGVRVVVKSPIVTYMNMSITITKLDPTVDPVATKSAVRQQVINYLGAFVLNQELILTELTTYIQTSIPAVLDMAINTPTENYSASADEVLRAGTVTVN